MCDINNVIYKRVTGNKKYHKRTKVIKCAKNVIFIDEVHIDVAGVSDYGWNEMFLESKSTQVVYNIYIPKNKE